MLLVGWNFTIEEERDQEPRLCVREEAGKTTRYGCIYSDLTALRRQVDRAEVAFYMETHVPLLAEIGWRVIIDDDAYILHTDEQRTITVPFNDVGKAHEVTQLALEVKATR